MSGNPTKLKHKAARPSVDYESPTLQARLRQKDLIRYSYSESKTPSHSPNEWEATKLERLSKGLNRQLQGEPRPGQVVVDSVRDIFAKEAARWKQETAIASSEEEKVLHSSYQRIIGLGPVAIPFILKDLMISPHFWFWALEAIARDNPIPEAHLGDVEAMASDWLEWGRLKGFV